MRAVGVGPDQAVTFVPPSVPCLIARVDRHWSSMPAYAAVNRTVLVDTAFITHALERIYKADRLLAELRGASKTATPAAP